MSAASCVAVRDLLPWFVGGDLEPGRVGAVREHLVQCWACRAEAAALQQGVRRLQQAAAAPAAEVDEAFFTDLQRRIVDEVRAADAPVGASRGSTLLSVWLGLAAVLLVGVGFWVGRGSGVSDPVFGRPPLATPAAFQPQPLVVPGSDGRVPMRWLGDERPLPAIGDEPVGDDGQGAGMMGRTTLRTLVDDRIVLPPRQPH